MISIIIPWRNRQQIASTFARFREVADDIQGEIIIVNFGGDYTFLNSLLPRQGRHRVKIINLNGIPYFNLSATRNIGAYHASHELLLFCDCDVFINTDVVRRNVDTLITHSNTFATPEWLVETDKSSLNDGKIARFRIDMTITLDDGRVIEVPMETKNKAEGARYASGQMFVRKAMLLSINGYNSGFQNWGWEDIDLMIRLKAELGASWVADGIFTHLTHSDEERVLHYKNQDLKNSSDRAYTKGFERYNQGNFLGTYHEDIARFHDYEVIENPSTDNA